jgi:hypothetical protein
LAKDRVGAGDLVAHLDHVTPGDLTVYASSFAGDRSDPSFAQRWRDHFSSIAFKCEQIGPDASVVVLEVPPQPRFD